ncbi:UvrD-helicase domain-containing protein [Heliorestis convoluta]|uniref:DNA 3'-5' helicase n=1 Tax=Heliorestis convoluta TaxID=356322 RepID=A0A5Q2MY54_9FIRM|nr:ATP-dependent helicase [Heliorestis convoluta]QGG46313.1 ATP-dependent helicase [Heliorestis convoluta]
MEEKIDSNTTIHIEQHFKIIAGPGAGKTHWLTNHVKNVLQNSTRLGRTAKIACITYTNVASEEIRLRLGETVGEKVEIGTIHNFLYKYIVKPYGFLLKDEEGINLINLEKMDGHDEHIPNISIIKKWIDSELGRRRFYLLNDDRIERFLQCLKNFDWILEQDDCLNFQLRSEYKKTASNIRLPKLTQKQLLTYKKYYWNKGQIHHEDVLYLAYRILKEKPSVIKFLSYKFPYLFIDEFQDTNPIQTSIVRRLAAEKTIVGVIGDSTQSIYKFQGAKREDFEVFELNELKEYYMPDNRRSTNNIVKFLQNIRDDELVQKAKKNREGAKVTVLVGDQSKALQYVSKIDHKACVLARNNETVRQLKYSSTQELGDLWVRSRVIDSNFQRQMFIYYAVFAVELIEQKKYEEALSLMKKIFNYHANGSKITQKKKRSFAIQTIERLYSLRNQNYKKTLYEYHNVTLEEILERFDVESPSAKITKRGKKFFEFANQYTYQHMVQSLRLQEDESLIRTIHKAKGCEFNTVLVVLEKKNLRYLFEPKIDSIDDDTRILYVGFSRAKEKLYINIPYLADDKHSILSECEIIDI